MATVISHNILSPLGDTSEANFQAVKTGKSSLRKLEHAFGTPLDITASVFESTVRKQLMLEGFTWFESLVIRSVKSALQQSNINCMDEQVCLVLSTTKANVEWLGTLTDEEVIPGNAARKIAAYLGFSRNPIVVCNACISGVSALITASRLIDAGIYRQVVVCGCDVLGKFIVSGFDSLKALSPDECRPFDEERIGLNLGEAAATMILSSEKGLWNIVHGEVCNDAYHISTPSPKAVGSGMALQRMGLETQEEWAFINLHGTATMYNDQMEWKAIEKAGVAHLPVNGYKGYFGHTMGAAGILECILSMLSVEDGSVLGTRGFQATGVSGNINISPHLQLTNKSSFVKLISGFGGCNAAIRFSTSDKKQTTLMLPINCQTLASVEITQHGVSVNHKALLVEAQGKELLTDIYKHHLGNYPRFYKMDILSQLGFVASELVLKSILKPDYEHMAVILFNRSSSLCVDKEYLASIAEPDNYFPSPRTFVYTLPNMVNGEIALRHGINEETAFYILPHKDETVMNHLMRLTLARLTVSCCLVGWLECSSKDEFVAELKLIKK